MTTQTAYAGFWLRAGALMIDSLILSAVFVVAGIALGLAFGAPDVTGFVIAIGVIYAIGFVGTWLYFALMEASAGQATLGKRAVGLIVTDLQGQRISVARAFGRKLSKLLNGLSFGIGWIIAGFTDRKQGLHDLVAGTLVVKKDPTRRSSGAAIAALCVGSIPVIGIIAAIGLPGLLRARATGNEVAAIRVMRTITAAQLSYYSRCGAYAPDLLSLASERAILGPELIARGPVTLRGYTFAIRTPPSATPVADVPSGCEGGVSNYMAVAVPVTPGASGIRFFAVDGNSTIIQDRSADFKHPQVVK